MNLHAAPHARHLLPRARPGRYFRAGPCTTTGSTDHVCTECTTSCPAGSYMGPVCAGDGYTDSRACQKITIEVRPRVSLCPRTPACRVSESPLDPRCTGRHSRHCVVWQVSSHRLWVETTNDECFEVGPPRSRCAQPGLAACRPCTDTMSWHDRHVAQQPMIWQSTRGFGVPCHSSRPELAPRPHAWRRSQSRLTTFRSRQLGRVPLLLY